MYISSNSKFPEYLQIRLRILVHVVVRRTDGNFISMDLGNSSRYFRVLDELRYALDESGMGSYDHLLKQRLRRGDSSLCVKRLVSMIPMPRARHNREIKRG